MLWRSWLRHCATSRKVLGFDSRWFHWNFSLTYSFRPHCGPGVNSASNRNEYQEYLLGVKAAGAWGWQTYHLHVPIVLKSGSLNLLEPARPVQACNGIALPLFDIRKIEAPLHNNIHDGLFRGVDSPGRWIGIAILKSTPFRQMQGRFLFTASFRSSQDTAASCRMGSRGCLIIPEIKLQYVSLTIHFHLVPNQKTSNFHLPYTLSRFIPWGLGTEWSVPSFCILRKQGKM